jgi:hypothetical protein
LKKRIRTMMGFSSPWQATELYCCKFHQFKRYWEWCFEEKKYYEIFITMTSKQDMLLFVHEISPIQKILVMVFWRKKYYEIFITMTSKEAVLLFVNEISPIIYEFFLRKIIAQWPIHAASMEPLKRCVLYWLSCIHGIVQYKSDKSSFE